MSGHLIPWKMNCEKACWLHRQHPLWLMTALSATTHKWCVFDTWMTSTDSPWQRWLVWMLHLLSRGRKERVEKYVQSVLLTFARLCVCVCVCVCVKFNLWPRYDKNLIIHHLFGHQRFLKKQQFLCCAYLKEIEQTALWGIRWPYYNHCWPLKPFFVGLLICIVFAQPKDVGRAREDEQKIGFLLLLSRIYI